MTYFVSHSLMPKYVRTRTEPRLQSSSVYLVSEMASQIENSIKGALYIQSGVVKDRSHSVQKVASPLPSR